VGSILRSRRRVLFRPEPEHNAMSKSEDLTMTAEDRDQSRSRIFNDHNHAGEVVPDRTTRQDRDPGTAAIYPVGSQIPYVPSIPMGTGYPEGRVVPHDSTNRGFSRHMRVIGIRKHPSHRDSLVPCKPCPPESGHGHARVHSENGTGVR
jgi:hypothetical protein